MATLRCFYYFLLGEGCLVGCLLVWPFWACVYSIYTLFPNESSFTLCLSKNLYICAMILLDLNKDEDDQHICYKI